MIPLSYERRVAQDRHDRYWLYVVTNCCEAPTLRDPIKDPARFVWNEVKKVEHYSSFLAGMMQN